MSDVPTKFIDLCLQGHALLDEIDDYIDQWHGSDSELDLPEYLGMTSGEYAAWIEEPKSLRFILYARNENKDFSKILADTNAMQLAARSASQEEAAAVEEWLKRTGRI